jgi:hypothetical protein
LADEYHVRVRLDGGPFEIDQEAKTVIKANQLRLGQDPRRRVSPLESLMEAL